MWLCENQLRILGFRRKSERYWRCDRRFDLPDAAHLSIFSGSEQLVPASSSPARMRRQARQSRSTLTHSLIELSEFHVTFLIGRECVRFYYRERHNNEWVPGGHTSRRKVARLGANPAELRRRADAVAAVLVSALGGAWAAR